MTGQCLSLNLTGMCAHTMRIMVSMQNKAVPAICGPRALGWQYRDLAGSNVKKQAVDLWQRRCELPCFRVPQHQSYREIQRHQGRSGTVQNSRRSWQPKQAIKVHTWLRTSLKASERGDRLLQAGGRLACCTKHIAHIAQGSSRLVCHAADAAACSGHARACPSGRTPTLTSPHAEHKSMTHATCRSAAPCAGHAPAWPGQTHHGHHAEHKRAS